MPARALASGMQFGFREGFSTIALDAVVNHIRDKICKNMVVIAVSFDVKNAFNSLSWSSIIGPWRGRGIRSTYDVFWIDTSTTFIEYPVNTGELRSRRVTCSAGVGVGFAPMEHRI